MKNQITSIGILQTGKMCAALYAAFSLMFIPFMLLASLGGGRFFGGVTVFLGMIVVYPIMGFVVGILSAAVYNFVAGIIGGIEITLEPIDDNFQLEDYRADEPLTE